MPIRASRQCTRCYNTAELGSNLCSKHITTAPEKRQRSELRKLYWRKLWRVHTRNAVLSRDAQCTHLTNGTRCMRLATDIDHIIDAETWVAAGNDFFDIDNLHGLCHAHHSSRTAREQGFASHDG